MNAVRGKAALVMLAVAGAMVGFAGLAGATPAEDPVTEAITDAQSKGTGYVIALVAMVTAICLAALAIKVVPKVYRLIAAKITG